MPVSRSTTANWGAVPLTNAVCASTEASTRNGLNGTGIVLIVAFDAVETTPTLASNWLVTKANAPLVSKATSVA